MADGIQVDPAPPPYTREWWVWWYTGSLAAAILTRRGDHEPEILATMAETGAEALVQQLERRGVKHG